MANADIGQVSANAIRRCSIEASTSRTVTSSQWQVVTTDTPTHRRLVDDDFAAAVFSGDVDDDTGKGLVLTSSQHRRLDERHACCLVGTRPSAGLGHHVGQDRQTCSGPVRHFGSLDKGGAHLQPVPVDQAPQRCGDMCVLRTNRGVSGPRRHSPSKAS